MKLPWGRRRGGRTPPPRFDPSRVVTWLTPDDPLTLGQLAEGCLIAGAIGSGKTSGPATAIVRGLLREGAGLLILAAKPGEYDRVARLAREEGRGADLVRFRVGGPWTMDVLEAELTAPGGTVESAAQLIDALMRLAQRNAGEGREEAFWAALGGRLIRCSVTLLYLASGTASLALVDEVVGSAPKTDEEYASAAFVEGSLCCRLSRHAAGLDLTPAERRDFDAAAGFLLHEFRRLAEKTRSIAETIVRNVTSKFVTGPLADLLSAGKTTLPPTACMDGAVIVADLPALQYRELGQFFGMAVRQLVSRATLRRTVTPLMRPVAIVADECQLFVDAETDAMTQTVAREARLISVAITQNLPTLFTAAGGGDRARQAITGWVGNHQTKIVCANSCADTNKFFAEMFGFERKAFWSGSTTVGEFDLVSDLLGRQTVQVSGGWNQQWHECVPAHAFTKLAKGGHDFGRVVEAFAFQGGRVWSNGKSFTKVAFDQRDA